MLQALRSDPLARMLGHTTVALVLATLTYYAIPLRFDRGEPWTVGRAAATLVVLALAVQAVRAQIRWSRRQSRDYLRIQWLLTTLYALVLVFALAYAVLAVQLPGQFVGLENRTEALYFSVTLVATVGFGDIHPNGTAAQVLAAVHMIFNLIYLGTAVRLLIARGPMPSADDDSGRDRHER